MSTTDHSPPSLPPISMFTSRSQPSSSLMPASPPTSGYDKHSSLPILPKPVNNDYYKERPELLSPPQNYYRSKPASTPSPAAQAQAAQQQAATPDQSTLWALFNQFQQQQQKEKSQERRGSDSQDGRGLSSEQVLAEKRRRNAGASARFRDRRKQRERELLDKCNELEQRSKEFENALRRVDPDHPILTKQLDYPTSRSITQSPPPNAAASAHDDNLFDRVGQLEHLMTRFRQEKETDEQKLNELEKENKYLKSLLIPVSLSRKSNDHKRIRLSDSSDNDITDEN
ncbi:hypothetical protein INT47_009417 [Mucor saturninus]|uniref:BZIP domain-containing protein n=1 Tax=Mucor saturninus TaxID=64648 RepID=A0A8H7QW40_9FUNG|nr:hypothetical protein INT47_009417 [Mucor saturninus]